MIVIIGWLIMGIFMMQTGGMPLPTVLFGFFSGILYAAYVLATNAN